MTKKFSSLLLTLMLILTLAVVPTSALELEDARQLLRDHYVDEIPEEVLALDSLEEILAALDDPYTVYFTAEEYDSFLSSVNGESVVGIGVSIQTVFQDGFQILSVLPDSPAMEAGLEAGDRVVAVDGVPLTDGSDVQGLITGEEDTQVTITILRQADGQEKTCILTRRAVTIPIVTYQQEGTVGYIDCTSFGSSTVKTMEEALTTMDKDVDLWMVDLRSNPGGTTDAACGAAGLFVGGETMVYFRDADSNYSFLYTLPSMKDYTDKPLILLTSAYSASGAELFAAAARDHGFAIAIGQRTYGKGVAQSVYDETTHPELFDGDALKVTTYRFYSPDGTTNHTVGVIPTLLVSQSNTLPIATLLSCPEPRSGQTRDHLRLDFGNFCFYVDLNEALKNENQAAFSELLAALPPSCQLSLGTGGGWTIQPTPQELAVQLGLDYQPRFAFSDLTEDTAVETLATYGLVSGYEDGTFRPNNTITRAEFCTLLRTALDLPANKQALAFSDTNPFAWYADPVSAMAARGFIAGYEDGTFRPNDTISYQEILAILSSAAAWISMEGDELNQEDLTMDQWLTYYDLPEWVRIPARNLTELGLTLDLSNPAAPATRLQAAHLLYQLMDVTNLLWSN